MKKELLNFQIQRRNNAIIKVIGVGGGGGNAVNHMFNEGIKDVTFALCNTDSQALLKSPVPTKVQLGEKITSGLGAGNKPEVARAAAEESVELIKELLNDGTQMVFITAGMGGGTGTGAAPVVARIAKEMGVLTVGIVSIPFVFEGERKIIQAIKGVQEISKNVDALLVINNERLRDIYHDLAILNAFAKADDTLAIAAKSIAELITIEGIVNLDFADVKTTLKDGGVAIMSRGLAEGKNRVSDAINDALNSPLLNNNDVFNAKKILLNLSFASDNQLITEEMTALHDFMSRFNREIEVIWGLAIDDELENNVKVTILATGFGINDVPGVREQQLKENQFQDEKQKAIEKEEKEIYDSYLKQIEKIYGKKGLKSIATNFRMEPFILTVEEMDDDRILEALEKTAVFKREREFDPRNHNKANPTPSSTLF